MSKRFFQIAAAIAAVLLFVLAPIACQQAEQPAEDAGMAKPADGSGGKQLMAAKPNKALKEGAAEAEEAVDGALDEAGEAVDDAGEAVDGAVEEGAEAVGDAVEEVTEGH